MAKASRVRPGDWIRVSGKTVKVIHAERHGNGKVHISYKAKGSKSGMLRPGIDAEVKSVYGGGWLI